jgi:hypothetical protein
VGNQVIAQNPKSKNSNSKFDFSGFYEDLFANVLGRTYLFVCQLDM